MEEAKDPSRRDWIKIASATVAGLVVGAAAGWISKPTEVLERIITSTMTHTVPGATVTLPPATTTVTITAPPTTPGLVPKSKEEVLAWYVEKLKPWKGRTLKTIIEANAPGRYMIQLAGEIAEAAGLKIDCEEGTHETCYEKEVLDMERGTGIYSYFFDDQDLLGTWYKRGWAVPINEYMSDYPELVEPWLDLDDFFTLPSVTDPEGNILQLPNEGVPSYYSYRTDLFNDPKEKEDFKKKYGWDLRPPKFDDEYEQIAEFFTRPDVPLYGHLTFYKYAHYTYHHFVVFDFGACSNGPLPYPRPVSPFGIGVKKVKIGEKEVDCACLAQMEKGGMIDSPQSIEGLETFRRLLKYAPPGGVGMEWMAMGDAWAAGILAQLWFNWPHLIPMYEDPEISKIIGKWSLAMCPVSRKYWKPMMPMTYLDIEGFLLPYCSKDLEASWLIMQYAKNKLNDLQQGIDIGFCTRTSSLTSPMLENIYKERVAKGMPEWMDYLNYWRSPDTAKYAIGTDPAILDYPTICETTLPWLMKAFSGELSASDAAKGMAKSLDDLFHELGYI